MRSKVEFAFQNVQFLNATQMSMLALDVPMDGGENFARFPVAIQENLMIAKMEENVINYQVDLKAIDIIIVFVKLVGVE